MRIAVVIASLGRAGTLTDLVADLAAQTRRPDHVVLSVTKTDDAPGESFRRAVDGFRLDVILSPIGSCAQRNAGIEHVGDAADIVIFFDDDFVPAPDYLQKLEKLFLARPDAAGATGLVLADGATGPGFTPAEARALIAGRRAADAGSGEAQILPNLYGCNMAFRRSAIEGVRFDERLPLYGWLEDVDFSAQAGRKGVLLKSETLVGVHLGVKGGRTSGVRFGYSQIVNPVYLLGKKTIGRRQAGANMLRTFAANHVKALAPEPYVDRLGRIRGNWLGIADVVRGRVRPERILTLD